MADKSLPGEQAARLESARPGRLTARLAGLSAAGSRDSQPRAIC